MKGIILKGTVCISLLAAALAFLPNAHAGHATNFLDALESEVTNRVANPGTNASRAELRALSNAARTLSRNTRTLSADLGALASAATQLDAQFADDETLATLEADAIADYSAEAHARLDGIFFWIGTNSVSRGLSNQVAKAEAALDRAAAETNGVPAQARTLAAAFNRILPVEKKVRSLFQAPILPPVIPPVVVTNPPPITLPPAVPPGTPGPAPDSVGTRFVTLYEDAVVNDQTVFYFSTAQTGAQIYNVHHPEELGLWNYVRTGANVAVIVVTPNYPNNAGQRLLNLTFTSASGGTFTGTTFFGEAIAGTFAVTQ
jgi:hypothetical protein